MNTRRSLLFCLALAFSSGATEFAVAESGGSANLSDDPGTATASVPARAHSGSRLYIPVRSGPGWKSSIEFQEGWQMPDFPDTSWDDAWTPYPNPTSPRLLAPDSYAQFIWHDPDGASDGTTGPNRVYLRYTFTLAAAPGELPYVGQALLNADDDFDFFVNGHLVLENHDEGFSDRVDLVDFTYALRDGLNVIAIEAVDGSWDNPRDRGYERVLMDGAVATGVLDWDILRVAQIPVYEDYTGPPSLDGSSLAFVALSEWYLPEFGAWAPGVYRIDIDTFEAEALVPDLAPLPNASGLFSFFSSEQHGSPSQDDGEVTFIADGVDPMDWMQVVQSGIYKASDGMVTAVATTDTPVPSGTGTFGSVAPLGPSLSVGNVVFHGQVGDFPVIDQEGVYAEIDGVLFSVASLNSPVPDLGTPFTSFGLGPSIDGRSVAFWGAGVSDVTLFHGMYLYDHVLQTLQIIADENTVMPGGAETFESFFSPAFRDGTIAFWGDGATSGGIFAWENGVLRRVSDPMEGVSSGFPATDSGNVAFLQNASIVTDIGGVLTAVTDTQEIVANISLDQGGWDFLSVYHEALSGNRIAFNGGIVYDDPFSGYQEGIMVAYDRFVFADDRDADGVLDDSDNCLEHANPGQTDSDGDNIGNVCDGDFDNNCATSFEDLGYIKSVFFTDDAEADLNASGSVSFDDLAILKSRFFQVPGPSGLPNACQ